MLNITDLREMQIQSQWDFTPTRISSAQFSCSVISDSLWPHGLQHPGLPCPSPIPGAYSLMSIELVMPSSHLILCHSLLLLPSIFPCIRVFPSESVLRIRYPKYWSVSFSISPSNEYSGVISFRMDWLDLLAVQGSLRVFSNTTVQKQIQRIRSDRQSAWRTMDGGEWHCTEGSDQDRPQIIKNK